MNADPLHETTRTKLDQVSRTLLHLHKSLLDDERAIYEAVHGQVLSSHEMFRLVTSDPQFMWLGKISSLIVLLDEAASLRRPATETNAKALLAEALTMLQLESEDPTFTERLQRGLKRSTAANANYETALQVAIAE